MKVVVVCQYYYPERFKITEICESLAEAGHSVTVLTGLPNYPLGRVPEEYRFGRRRKERIRGVDAIRTWEIGRRSGAIGLAMNYLSFLLSASVKALTLKAECDVIFIYQLSPITMAVPGIILKHRLKKPVYMYSLDMWPESMKVLVANERGFAFRAVRQLSRYLYASCDAIGVTSEPFIDYLVTVHGVPVSRISYVPQHAEDAGVQPSAAQRSDVTEFLFMGNMGLSQDIDCIVDAAAMIRDTVRFKVHFVGDGSYLETTKTLVALKGLEDHVVLHGGHPTHRMAKFYRMADACLLAQKSDNLTGMTVPARLQGYMSAGKPVIAATDGAAKQAIEESGCGVCVGAGDSVALAAALKDFHENRFAYERCGENARAYYEEHFTKHVFMQQIEGALTSLAEGRSAADGTTTRRSRRG